MLIAERPREPYSRGTPTSRLSLCTDVCRSRAARRVRWSVEADRLAASVLVFVAGMVRSLSEPRALAERALSN